MSLNILNRRSVLKELILCDIAIIALILFGEAAYSSTVIYIDTLKGATFDWSGFTPINNWQMLFRQFITLSIAFIYLWVRGFDFSKFKIKITLKGTLFGVVLFIISSLILDFGSVLFRQIFRTAIDEMTSGAVEISNQTNLFSHINLSLIFYAILNGFYEEIFFLGICLSVNPKYKNIYFIVSLLIRFSFHTYQGIENAIILGFVYGAVYYIVYRLMKKENLYPFFVSHTLGDIFGTSIVYYLAYLVM